MKGNEKKILVFEILLMIILFLNNFVSNILKGYIEVVFLIIILAIFYFLFGFTRDRHHLWRNVCTEVLIFLLVFFIFYYILGLVITFSKTNNYYNIVSLINIIIPLILIIILKEILRYMILAKTYGNKSLIIICFILFIILDLIGKYNSNTFVGKYSGFLFIATVLLPTISKNILCTYLSYKVGYKPVMLYVLITTLFSYVLPIIPNPNPYIYSIIWLLMPLILLYRIYFYLAKEKHDFKIEVINNKKKFINLLVPIIIVAILVYFVSGYFHYHAIVVASGSMETEISKGDVVIISKIDGNTDLLDLNQVIAYHYDNRIVVHRLVKKIIVNNEPIFYTKGDANNDLDNYKITKDMIIGIVSFKIPYIGYPTVWLNEL